MKILAVIPACEGSTSMPNKNIRVINGKPLIYYVINNAKKSRYITDIIVTTNSETIITIAKQMGVMVRYRDSCLCNDCVPLDAVVYDVFQQLDLSSYDYVVTMQSISPTLRVETLDYAFEECFQCCCDTMISVANKARFYWQQTDNGPTPLQKTRTSRHRLPPFYLETGAFFITRNCFIRPDSRIGNIVRLYELSGDETIDVDNFGDLRLVENILNKKDIAFYVNGNNQIGLGHIYRVIELADEFYTKPDIYFDINQTNISAFGSTTHNLIPVKGIRGLLEALKGKKYDRFINDVLSTSEEYMKALKKALPSSQIINFEDEGDGAAQADLVFNALYEESSASNVRVGEEYFVASKLFLLYDPIQIKEEVKNVFISFGGADPSNYIDRVLKIISQKKYHRFCFYIVIGSAKQNANQLKKYQCNNIIIFYNISNMPEVMSQCDVAITSRGRTGFELALLGIPSVCIAHNEREDKHEFLSYKNGFFYLGINPDDNNIDQAIFNLVHLKRDQRQILQQKMLDKNLRNGRKCILNLIDNL